MAFSHATRCAEKLSAEFKSCQCKKGKHEGCDPETDDDFGLGPAEDFEVVVEGGHFEDAFAAEFVAADLEDDGEPSICCRRA